jgi:hypothetical protein
MISLFGKNCLPCIKSDLKEKYGTVERIGSLKGKLTKFKLYCFGRIASRETGSKQRDWLSFGYVLLISS